MVKSIERMKRNPLMCCFMGMVTMTYWSLSQKKVARNNHVEVGYALHKSSCLNQISLNNLRSIFFHRGSVSADLPQVQ
jgi:hypothetical protein